MRRGDTAALPTDFGWWPCGPAVGLPPDIKGALALGAALPLILSGWRSGALRRTPPADRNEEPAPIFLGCWLLAMRHGEPHPCFSEPLAPRLLATGSHTYVFRGLWLLATRHGEPSPCFFRPLAPLPRANSPPRGATPMFFKAPGSSLRWD